MGPGPVPSEAGAGPRPLEGISAVTLATHDMGRAVRFYQALGFTKVLLAEGPTDVRAVQQFLRKHGRDHHVLVLPLGGSSGIKERSQEELNELKRITTDVSALIDSEINKISKVIAKAGGVPN